MTGFLEYLYLSTTKGIVFIYLLDPLDRKLTLLKSSVPNNRVLGGDNMNLGNLRPPLPVEAEEEEEEEDADDDASVFAEEVSASELEAPPPTPASPSVNIKQDVSNSLYVMVVAGIDIVALP